VAGFTRWYCSGKVGTKWYRVKASQPEGKGFINASACFDGIGLDGLNKTGTGKGPRY